MISLCRYVTEKMYAKYAKRTKQERRWAETTQVAPTLATSLYRARIHSQAVLIISMARSKRSIRESKGAAQHKNSGPQFESLKRKIFRFSVQGCKIVFRDKAQS